MSFSVEVTRLPTQPTTQTTISGTCRLSAHIDSTQGAVSWVICSFMERGRGHTYVDRGHAWVLDDLFEEWPCPLRMSPLSQQAALDQPHASPFWLPQGHSMRTHLTYHSLSGGLLCFSHRCLRERNWRSAERHKSWHSVAYFSRKLTAPEMNYAITELDVSHSSRLSITLATVWQESISRSPLTTRAWKLCKPQNFWPAA